MHVCMYVCMRIMIFFSFEPTGDPRAAVRIISKKNNSSLLSSSTH